MTRSSVFAAVLVTASCTARTEPATPTRAAPPPPSSAAAPNKVGDLFDGLLRLSMDRLHLPLARATIDRSESQAKERIDFLNGDFETTAFARARKVASASVLPAADGARLHLGIVDLEFPTCAELGEAQKAVVRSDRTNFRLPVLTVFAVVAGDHHLALVFSETSARPDIRALLGDVASFATDRRACEDQK